MEKIQNGLTTLLTPSNNNSTVETAKIIEYQNKYFLKITGREDEKCMVVLKETNGDLFESKDNNIPIVVCYGCAEGCEPRFEDGNWYCTEGCPECVKSSSISDRYIFE